MSGLIPQRFIEELLDRVDIAEVVGSRVDLKRTGGSFKARCPFHDERTPSFHVRPDKGFYHCFGCGAHGDAIAFVREFENLGFTEAVEQLAARAGLTVPYDKAVQEEVRQTRTLTQALDAAAQYYRKALASHPASAYAREYLTGRGLDEAIQERFQLGFAPPGNDTLYQAMDDDSRHALMETGNISNRYGQPRDFFRNRIIFPIRDPRGRTRAFGGRALGDEKAKYINSPESDIFHKSRVIYGLYEALQTRRQLDRLLVVEGYMDVIALAQHGIGYAVACMGTATNPESLKTLLRQSRHIIFCFDGDQAGYRAADRAMENVLPEVTDGIHLQFLMLPEGEDPDSLVRKEGPGEFQKRIDQAIPLSRYLFERLSEGLDLSLPENRGELRTRAEPLLRKMPRSTLNQAMWYELGRLCRGPRPDQTSRAEAVRRQPLKPANQHEMTVCAALLWRPGHAADWLALLEQSGQYPASAGFAAWILENRLGSREDIFFRLATDAEDRARFHPLFDGARHWFDEPSTLAAAQELMAQLQRKREQRLQAQAVRTLSDPAKKAGD